MIRQVVDCIKNKCWQGAERLVNGLYGGRQTRLLPSSTPNLVMIEVVEAEILPNGSHGPKTTHIVKIVKTDQGYKVRCKTSPQLKAFYKRWINYLK